MRNLAALRPLLDPNNSSGDGLPQLIARFVLQRPLLAPDSAAAASLPTLSPQLDAFVRHARSVLEQWRSSVGLEHPAATDDTPTRFIPLPLAYEILPAQVAEAYVLWEEVAYVLVRMAEFARAHPGAETAGTSSSSRGGSAAKTHALTAQQQQDLLVHVARMRVDEYALPDELQPAGPRHCA